MSKIANDAAEALFSLKNFKRDNTLVLTNSEGTATMYLHGNCISVFHARSNQLDISFAGRPNKATKSRLNAILSRFNSKIYAKDFRDYLKVDDKIIEMPLNRFVSIDLDTLTIKWFFFTRKGLDRQYTIYNRNIVYVK